MRVILICFVFQLCLFSLQAQTVSGVVVNSKGKPLSGASVKEVGTRNFAMTDEYGNFELLTSKRSSFKYKISSFGYQTELKSFRKESEEIRVVLKEDYKRFDKVFFVDIETAKRRLKERMNAEIPVEDIKFQGVGLSPLVDRKNGYYVRESGDLDTRASYLSTGLPNNKSRYFIDGLPLKYFGDVNSINSLPFSMIDRVELNNRENPISLISDTYGRPVNFRTKQDYDDTFELSYAIGSFNTHQVAATGYSRNNVTGITFRGNTYYNHSDNNYKVWGDDVPVTDPESGELKKDFKVEKFNDAYFNVGAKIDIGVTKKSWADQLFLSTLFSNKYDEVQHGATMEIPFGERYYREEILMPSLNYEKRNLFWKGFDVKLFSAFESKRRDVNDISKYKYNWLGEKVEDDSVGEQTAALSFTEDGTAISRILVDYTLNHAHSISFSNVFTDFKRNVDDLKIPEEQRSFDEKRNIKKNIFGVAYKNTSRDYRLTTSFFAKYYAFSFRQEENSYDSESGTFIPETYSNKENDYAYGVFVNYNLNDKWSFKSILEKTVVLPMADELLGNDAESVLTTVGQDDIEALKPEEVINTEVSVSFNNSARRDHHFYIGAHVFYRNIKNFIQANVARIDGMDYFFYENHEKIVRRGIELQFNYKFINMLDFSLSTSINDDRNVAVASKSGEQNLYLNSRLKNEPYLQVNSAVNFRTFYGYFNQDVQFTFFWTMNYVHEYLRTWEVEGTDSKSMIPSQFINNVGVNYGFPNKVTYLSFEVRNVFNEQVFNKYAIQLPGRGVFFKIGLRL